jgi:hypothetical protein
MAAPSGAVSAGVILHLPMFLEAAPMHYRMAGMPMGMPMLVGMALIGVGTIAAGFESSFAVRRGSRLLTVAFLNAWLIA